MALTVLGVIIGWGMGLVLYLALWVIMPPRPMAMARTMEAAAAQTPIEPGIVEVLKHVTELRDAWEEMLQRGASEVDITHLARPEQPTPPSARQSP